MQIVTINLLILFFGVIIPAVLPYLLEDRLSTNTAFSIRIITLIIVVLSGVILLVFNLRSSKKSKLIPIFVLLSIGVTLYFGYLLLVTYAFRNFGF